MEEAFRKKVEEIYLNLGSLNEYELLDVDKGSDEKTIKKNYHRLVKEFHPDRYFGSADPIIQDKLSSIFAAITRAYTILKEGKKGIKDYIPSGEVREDEISLAQKAEEHFNGG